MRIPSLLLHIHYLHTYSQNFICMYLLYNCYILYTLYFGVGIFPEGTFKKLDVQTYVVTGDEWILQQMWLI